MQPQSRENFNKFAEVCDGLCTLKRSVPVIEFEAALRVWVAGAVAEGRVLEAICLHPVELVVDVADEAGGVLQQYHLSSLLKAIWSNIFQGKYCIF